MVVVVVDRETRLIFGRYESRGYEIVKRRFQAISNDYNTHRRRRRRSYDTATKIIIVFI